MITPITRTESVTRRCWVCRCTDEDACWDIAHPCFWVLEDLCSSCARRLLEKELRPQIVRDGGLGMDSERGVVQPRRREGLSPRVPRTVSTRDIVSQPDPMELLSLGRDPEPA